MRSNLFAVAFLLLISRIANCQPAPISPSGQTPAAGANALVGYAVLASNDSGKALSVHLANVDSVKAALQATFPDLARYFDSPPTLGRAFQDVNNPNMGGATFTTQLKGKPTQGVVTCQVLDTGGATVTVVYGRADGPKSDWETLMNPPAPLSDLEPAPDRSIALQTYNFPDGSGSIGLANGWTTNADSIIKAINLVGPGDQNVSLGFGIPVYLPDSQNVQQYNQEAANVAQQNARNANDPLMIQLKPPPPVFQGPLVEPVEAVKSLIPQFDAYSRWQNGSSQALDNIISTRETASNFPGGKAAILVFEVTIAKNGQPPVHYRSQARVETAPLMPQAWMYRVDYEMRSPVETFDRDRAVMWAMATSLKGDPEGIQRAAQLSAINSQQIISSIAAAGQQWINNFNQQCAAENAQNAANHQTYLEGQRQAAENQNAYISAQDRGNAERNMQWANDEWQKNRSSADVAEFAGGQRQIVDQQTGEQATVDLNYSRGIVNALNEAALDPNRCVEIPLRDQLYPSP